MKRSRVLLSSSILVLLAGQAVNANPNSDRDVIGRIQRVGERLNVLLQDAAPREVHEEPKQVQYFGNWDNWGDEDEPIWNNWDNFHNFDNYQWDSY
jgi:hypothetical protein